MENSSTERKPFDLRAESKAYAIESIKLYQHLTEYAPEKEYNLSKHYLIAATRGGCDFAADCLPLGTKKNVLFQQAAYTNVSGTFFSSQTLGAFDFDINKADISVSLD